MRKVSIAVAVAAGLVAATATGFWVRNKAIGPDGWALDDTKADLRGIMKDPDSLTLRGYFIVRQADASGGTQINVCGLVDGRNSFGALTGGDRFVSQNDYSSELGTFDHLGVHIEDRDLAAQAHQAGMLSAFEKVYCNSSCVDKDHPPLAVQAPAGT